MPENQSEDKGKKGEKKKRKKGRDKQTYPITQLDKGGGKATTTTTTTNPTNKSLH